MTTETIRPAVQALIAAGNVEIDQVEHFDPPCNLVEAEALIPAWTNSAFARVLDRTLINLRLVQTSPWWTVYQVLQEVEKNINRPIGQAQAQALNSQLAAALAGIGNVTTPATTPTGYLLTAFNLANEAQKRLAAWPATPPAQQ
jgi:hypothetical protein